MRCAVKLGLRTMRIDRLKGVYPTHDLLALPAVVATPPHIRQRLVLSSVDADQPAIGQDELDLCPDQAVKRSIGFSHPARLVDEQKQMIHCLIEESSEQLVFAREVSVDRRAGDSHLSPDLIQRYVIKAALEKLVGCGIQDLFVSSHIFSFSHWSSRHV
jgi:hypothetical protein